MTTEQQTAEQKIFSPVVPESIPLPVIDDYTVHWIDANDTAQKALETLMTEDVVGVDLEADNMFHYDACLAIIQVCTRKDVYLFDTIALKSPGLFQPFFSKEGPEKIIHDAAFDVRLLNIFGVIPEGIFDTALSAKLLSERSVGLSSILSRYFGISLNKECQTVDWTIRPLKDGMISYLVHDVIYLHGLYEFLKAAIVTADIVDEVNCELEYIQYCAAREATLVEQPLFTRIKGWHKLTLRELSVLKEVCKVRDKKAKELDMAPSRVIKNSALITIARKMPRSEGKLLRLERWNKTGKSIVSDIINAIKTGTDAVDLTQEELTIYRANQQPRMNRQEVNRSKGLKKMLTAFRDKKAKDRAVDPQVIIPGHCMKEICSQKPHSLEDLAEIPGFGLKRLGLYGEDIVKIVRTP